MQPTNFINSPQTSPDQQKSGSKNSKSSSPGSSSSSSAFGSDPSSHEKVGVNQESSQNIPLPDQQIKINNTHPASQILNQNRPLPSNPPLPMPMFNGLLPIRHPFFRNGMPMGQFNYNLAGNNVSVLNLDPIGWNIQKILSSKVLFCYFDTCALDRDIILFINNLDN